MALGVQLELAEACVCPKSSPPQMTPRGLQPDARSWLHMPLALSPPLAVGQLNLVLPQLVVSPGTCPTISGSPEWQRTDLPRLVLGIERFPS